MREGVGCGGGDFDEFVLDFVKPGGGRGEGEVVPETHAVEEDGGFVAGWLGKGGDEAIELGGWDWVLDYLFDCVALGNVEVIIKRKEEKETH